MPWVVSMAHSNLLEGISPDERPPSNPPRRREASAAGLPRLSATGDARGQANSTATAWWVRGTSRRGSRRVRRLPACRCSVAMRAMEPTKEAALADGLRSLLRWYGSHAWRADHGLVRPITTSRRRSGRAGRRGRAGRPRCRCRGRRTRGSERPTSRGGC